MTEEVMLCVYADVVNNDHGYASLHVHLESPGREQTFVLSPKQSYDVLRIFDVDRLSKCAGLPVVVMRTSDEMIQGMKRLSCYPPYEVKR